MGNDQQPSAFSSKTEKPRRHRFSRAAKTFLEDYFHNTSNKPKQNERDQILAHIKELGDAEVTDARITIWFRNFGQKERRRPSLPLSTSALESKEKIWVDARHKSLWPSLTRKTLKDLEDLYVEHVAQDGAIDPPYDLWAEGLGARPAHVRMWCKFKARESTRQSQPGTALIDATSSQMREEHSQLPTPGTSTSPEPHPTSLPLPPNTIKDEPPVSPVVETTQFQPRPENPREKSSMGLHEAIESAFCAPLYPPTPSIQPPRPPSPTTQISPQRKTSSRNSCQTIDVIPPPTLPSISANIATALPPTSSPPVPTTSPPSNPEHPTPLSHREPSAPPLQEEPIPGPSTQPDRDIARERANIATGVAAKLDEISVLFSSPHGLSQFAGTIETISQRNQRFLNDVAAGRYAHMRLTGEHLPGHQFPSTMPEFNPQRVLADWRNGEGKGKEKEKEGDEMEVD